METFFFPFPLFPLSFPTLFLLPPPLAPSLKKLETDHCDDKNVSHYYFPFFRMGVTATAGRSQKRTIKNLFLCHKNFSLLPSPSSSKLNPPPPSFLLLFGETSGGALFFFLSPSLPPFPLREIEMPTAIAHIMQWFSVAPQRNHMIFCKKADCFYFFVSLFTGSIFDIQLLGRTTVESRKMCMLTSPQFSVKRCTPRMGWKKLKKRGGCVRSLLFLQRTFPFPPLRHLLFYCGGKLCLLENCRAHHDRKKQCPTTPQESTRTNCVHRPAAGNCNFWRRLL